MAKIKVILTYYTKELNPEYFDEDKRTPKLMYEIDKKYYEDISNLVESIEFADADQFSIETELIQ